MGRGLLVGRFQPFHRGHLAVLRDIRTANPRDALLLGVGSAQESYTVLNPFTSGERIEMIERSLREAEIIGCTAHPLVDIDRHSLWVAHLETLLPPFDRVYTNNPLTRLLFERGGYSVESPKLQERDRWEGAHVRDVMAKGGEWTDLVPPAAAQYLSSIRGADRVALLARGTGPRARGG